jgi:predicted nuclease of predicted toxin-antitoxin system
LRVLLDESLPIELADELSGVDITTVRAQRWLRLRNGVLLRAAVDAGFSIILTADQDLPYQQNLPKIGIAAVIVTGVRNRIEELRPLIPKIVEALAAAKPGEVIEVTG